jgi:hypothetical protein
MCVTINIFFAPLIQLEQKLLPVNEYVPKGHIVQTDGVSIEEKDPAGQEPQTVAPL